jgi:hypothetical protein
MIALCAEHAALADGGRWTKDQLKKMKENPYVRLDKLSEYYGYLRKNTVCWVGNVAYEVENVLEISGERAIGFRRDDEGYNRLNLLVRGKNGNPILVMENNFWIANSKALFDLVCSFRGKKLEIVSKDRKTNLFMRFDDYPLKLFISRLREYYLQGFAKTKKLAKLGELHSNAASIDDFISLIGSPKIVPTWTIAGRLSWGGVDLDINQYGITDLKNHSFFGMSFVFRGKTAFGFREESVVFGVSGN